MEYLSKQRYDEIAAELKHLINEVYPQVTDDLAEASAQGDRSDNAGYREARRMQGKTISRIRFLQKILEHSRVIDPDALPKDRVCLLSRVEFKPGDKHPHEIRDCQPPRNGPRGR